MSNLVVQDKNLAAVESALVQNDLSKMTTDQRLSYYKAVCESVGLNYMTQPFAYITLQGKITLYAKRDAADQLRKIHGVSISIVSREKIDDLYVVAVKAKDKSGREDEATGIIPIAGLKGEQLANAMLKCETKAKRRVTLSICGLGILDETEIDSIKDVKPADNPQIPNPFAKDDLPEQIETTVEEMKDAPLGEYVCRVGKKYAGKALKDIEMFELNNYLEWLQKSAKEKGQNLTGDWLEFYEHAEAYLCSLEVNKSEEFNP